MVTTTTDSEEAAKAAKVLREILGDDLERLLEAIGDSPEAITTVDQLYPRVCVGLTHRCDCWLRITRLVWVAYPKLFKS